MRQWDTGHHVICEVKGKLAYPAAVEGGKTYWDRHWCLGLCVD